MQAYPYFVFPLIEELRHTSDPQRAAELRKLLAANVGDRDALTLLIGTREIDFTHFYPDQNEAELSTDDTISSFLSKFGGKGLAPAPQVLAEEEALSSLQAPLTSEIEEKEENSLETVKKLVKNREYGRALEIMEAIYLNNPKKSIYFADQIRFIKKMMFNESKK